MRLLLALFLLIPQVGSAKDLDALFFKLRREQRRVYAHQVKCDVASFDASKGLPSISNNGDEALYANLRGTFGKALSHDTDGFIERTAFTSLLRALQTETPSDFDLIQLGTGRKLVNPQGSLACSLPGNDSWICAIPAAPTFASAEAAGEMVELYWTALVRDVAFNAFDTNGIVGSAVTDLNLLSDFRGPKESGSVTRTSFLRGNAPGELTGPYISQFLYQSIPFGATTVEPEITVPTAATSNNFLTNFTDWYTVANGGSTGDSITNDSTKHFIRCPRDLGAYVHSDFPGQAAFCAALLLNSYGTDALDPANPYKSNSTQEGFVTFGIGEILALVEEAIEEGLKAAWFHKWQVNRRCRPEEYGFYVQRQLVNGDSLGISSELTGSTAVSEIFSANSTYFLPQAYPEGSPTHPSYPAGHATLIGAAVTILKAIFDEDYLIQSPLEPNSANTALVSYGSDLTVGGELNKLASNISLGRDHAGVHYRSDGWQGMLLGEQVAIDILNNLSFLFNENFTGYTLTKFDGTQTTVGGKNGS